VLQFMLKAAMVCLLLSKWTLSALTLRPNLRDKMSMRWFPLVGVMTEFLLREPDRLLLQELKVK
jgi:hypothetical protein